MRWIICLLLLLGCRSSPPTVPSPPVRGGQGAAPLPLAQLLQAVERENQRMEDIHGTQSGAGQLLGQLNGKLNAHGFMRRVPGDIALDGLESQLRQLATTKGLTVNALQTRVLPLPPSHLATHLQAGERWSPDLDDLRGVVGLTLDLQGARDDVAAYIDALPRNVERLVVVHAAGPVEGGIRLEAEAYYERVLPPPQLDIRWPSLDERLLVAGWQPDDPKLRTDPAYEPLRAQVDLGRRRLPDVRKSLQITSDFPRHLLRTKFFDERAAVVSSTRGAELLSRGGMR